MKVCKTCNKEKHKTEFYQDKNGKEGLRFECKNCVRIRGKNWRKNNKHVWQNTLLLKKYGLSQQEFSDMKQSQNGKCAICQCVLIDGKMTCVDHCHMTGKIRGILCTNCNVALGHFKDSIPLMESAIQYLKGHQ